MNYDKDFFLECLQESLSSLQSMKPKSLSYDIQSQQEKNIWKKDIKNTKLIIEKIKNNDLATLKKDPSISDHLYIICNSVFDGIFRRNPNDKRTDGDIAQEVIELFMEEKKLNK